MNVLTGIENLVQQPRILNTPYWSAFMDTDDDKSRIREYSKEKGGNIDESMKEIRELLNCYADSGANLVFRFYPVSEKDNYVTNRGWYTIKFNMKPQNGSAFSAFAGMGAISPDEIEKRVEEKLTAKLEEMEQRRKQESLQKENEDLKRQLKESEPGPLDRIIGRLEPVIDIVLKKTFPDMNTNKAAAAIGSVSDAEAQRITEESLSALSEGEDDFHITLKKLADLKKTDPVKYKLAKSML